MLQQRVKFCEADDIIQFVNAAEKCNFPVKVSYHMTKLNAKSLVAVFSFGLCKTLTVHCYGENEEFLRTLKKFTVA